MDVEDPPSPLPVSKPPQLELSSPRPLNTYIVQIPRDQIYRIPPPENEIILRNIDIAASKRKKRDPRCCYGMSILVVILILVGIFFSVFRVYLHPIKPEFSVVGLVISKSLLLSTHNKHANPNYDVTLKARNPNTKMDIVYQKGGNVSLFFKRDTMIGDGEYPSISQESRESTTIHVTLAGLTTKLPRQIESRMKMANKTSSEEPILLSLVISEPVELMGLITLKKHLTVVCDFRVNTFSLSKKPKIISQECHTNF